MDQKIYIKSRHYAEVLTLIVYLLAPLILLRSVFSKKRDVPQRILVVPQLTRIGDVVCSTGVFSALKKKYPQSRLSVLAGDDVVGILKHNPRIDELIMFESFTDFGLVRKIKEGNFDVGISLSGTAESSLLFFLGGVPQRIKLQKPQRPWSEYLTDWMNTSIEKYSHHEYIPEFYTRLLRHAGVENMDSNAQEVFTTDSADTKARHFFTENSLAHQLVIGISVSAGNKIKEWGMDKFTLLAKKIHTDFPSAKIVFIGAPRDRTIIERIVAGTGENFPIATSFSLEELPSLIKLFSLFISVDTGPMHIAHALKVPLIDILGPVDSNELTPRDSLSIIVKSTPPVPPTIFAFQSPGDPALSRKAMEAISVDAVFGAVQESMSRIQNHA